jgi:hypothetical protein
VEDFSVPFVGEPLTAFSPIDEDYLRKLIAKSRKTSCELDPVPTQLVVQYLDILVPVILKLLNSCLHLGQVPQCFKKAVVKPLLKKSTLDTSECKNYRPVSNLAYLSKLLERVVAEQLSDHLRVNNCLDKFQSAYRPGFSTETALLRVINDILCNVNAGNLVLLVLLDLSAAFDTINHGLLLQRLTCEIGIQDFALQWFASYLSGRSQRVIVGAAFSEEVSLVCGVPQGSVLGPILFSLYTSQLGRVIERFQIGRQFFADDTQLLNTLPPDPALARSALERLESCCVAVKSWMTRNRLKLNDDKTEALLCGPKARRELISTSAVQVCDASIPFADSVRDLGLIIDAELSMTQHINSIVSKCYYHLRTLGKLRPVLTCSAANSLAVATVTSRLDYCNSALWSIPASQVDRLQRIQNTAARIVTRTKTSDHIKPVLRDLHWLPVSKRMDYKVLSLAHACMHKTAPDYLREIVPAYEPSRRLRSSSQSRFSLPAVEDTNKKRSGARAFSNAAPKLWNSLPDNLKNIESASLFRKKLKAFLF